MVKGHLSLKKKLYVEKNMVRFTFVYYTCLLKWKIKHCLLFNCLVDILMKPSGTVLRASNCLAVDREHDSWPSKVHSAFHPYRIDKMSIRLAWELNTGGLADHLTGIHAV